MRTLGYGGKKLQKSITVITNDKKAPRQKVTFTGRVEKFATITPKKVKLKGTSGKSITAQVKIIPEKKYEFSITEIKADKGENIRYSLEKEEGAKGKGYILTVENLKTVKGKYRDTIRLKTTSKIRPEIAIKVYGYIESEKIAKVTPEIVRLRGAIGKNITAKVKIIPEKKHEFSIIEIKAEKGENIRYSLEKDKGAKEKGYVLTIENLKTEGGRYKDTIHLKTNSPVQPVITIPIYGSIFDEKGDSANNPLKLLEILQKAKQQQGVKGDELNLGNSGDVKDKKE